MKSIKINGHSIAVADRARRITGVRETLDSMADARYLYESDALVLYKENLPEAFFDLKTGLAGEILQKFSNYRMRLAIVGDFSGYPSKALRAFILECNRGGLVFWAAGLDDALAALAPDTARNM